MQSRGLEEGFPLLISGEKVTSITVGGTATVDGQVGADRRGQRGIIRALQRRLHDGLLADRVGVKSIPILFLVQDVDLEIGLFVWILSRKQISMVAVPRL
jgi:hypothetical protein